MRAASFVILAGSLALGLVAGCAGQSVGTPPPPVTITVTGPPATVTAPPVTVTASPTPLPAPAPPTVTVTVTALPSTVTVTAPPAPTPTPAPPTPTPTPGQRYILTVSAQASERFHVVVGAAASGGTPGWISQSPVATHITSATATPVRLQDLAIQKLVPGTQITLTAVASTGWMFDSWGGGLSGSANPAVLTMDSDKFVIAYFRPYGFYFTFSANPVGSGDVTVRLPNSQQSLSMGPDNLLYPGIDLELIATPRPGYIFDYWSGDASGTAARTTVALTKDMNFVANFKRAP